MYAHTTSPYSQVVILLDKAYISAIFLDLG